MGGLTDVTKTAQLITEMTEVETSALDIKPFSVKQLLGLIY